MVDREAVGVPTTDSTALAWVLALAINAGQIWWAVVVCSATNSAVGEFTNSTRIAIIVSSALRWRQQFDAVVFWISCVVRQASTDSVMVDGFANSINATRTIDTTWVLANISNANFQEGAVLVVTTPRNAVAMTANASNSTVIVLEARPWFSNFFALYLSIALEA